MKTTVRFLHLSATSVGYLDNFNMWHTGLYARYELICYIMKGFLNKDLSTSSLI